MNKTGIEYADYSWNPVPGCSKVSEACVDCWAETMAVRLKAMGQHAYDELTDDKGRWTGKSVMLQERLPEPLKVRKPARIVVNFMGDLFHKNVTSRFLNSVFEVMELARQHTFFVLTKRPDRAAAYLAGEENGHYIDALDHVKIGTTVENQRRADERQGSMWRISNLGWDTWVSYEPALGAVEWHEWDFLDWMVCGGESNGKRPMHPDWARKTRDWCLETNTPFFFKQWGDWVPVDHLPWVTDDTTFATSPIDYDGAWMVKVGKHLAGRVLDGRTWEEYPNA